MTRKMKDSGVEWIGEIPEGWDVVRGKYILQLLSRPVKETDGVITCFRDGEVTLRSNRREDGFTMADKEIGYQGINPGDLVVHGMDGFAGAIGISDSRGKGSPVLNVLSSSQNKTYLMYYLRTLAFSEVFLAISTGIRIRSTDLRWTKLATLPYVIPPQDEQLQIVDFLTRKLMQTNELISKVQEQIEGLEKYKKSIITETVTKGLDKSVPMKDSGIEWIGEIPEHWAVTKLKYTASLHNGDRGVNYPSGNDLVEDGIYFLTSNNIHGEFLDLNKEISKFITRERYDLLSGVKIQINDLVFCLRGSVGNCSLNTSLSEGTVASSLMVIRPRKIDSYFLNYFMQSSLLDVEVANYINGSCAANLSAENVLNFNLPEPPMSEQLALVDLLNRKCQMINNLLEQKQQQLQTLEEYKKSIIYEYVTGKKEVPHD